MKTRLLCAFICLFGLIPSRLFSSSCIQQGPDTIRTVTNITGGCIINGDLIILDGGGLHVDLTGGQPDTFVVRGNILLQGNAALWINADSGSTNAQFIVSNTTNNQRTITTQGNSHVMLQYVELRTQEGDLSQASSYYMNYNAQDSSTLSVTGCFLNTQTAWLLCNLFNNSTLLGNQTNEVPTEVYLQDTARMSISGAGTNMGVWMLFQGATDTLNLPDQTGGPFSWQAGRGMAGVRQSHWFLNVDSTKPGLGVQVQPFSKLVVNGTGLPVTGEIHANLLFANGTDTVENLGAGLQNLVVAGDRLTLNNVNLGPLGWQLYSVSNENLFISHSLVNEIGITGPANTVVVDSSTLQLATLSALGTGSSSLTVGNSQIWSQAITAQNGSTITLNDCSVTGSWFSTDAGSGIHVNGGCFYANPSGCTPNTMVNIATGQPYCNPFIPAGYPQNLSPSTVMFNGVSNNCTTGIEPVSDEAYLTIYPNPFSSEATIAVSTNIRYYSLVIYNSVGQEIRRINDITAPVITLPRGNLATGVYFIGLAQQNGIVSTAKLVVAE